MKFHFSIAVWGDSFIDVFTKIHLPSLLSPGNLPAFIKSYPLEYRIYTTPEDARKIKELAAYKQFAAVIPTRIFASEVTDFSDVGLTHRVFNDFMRIALADAEAEGASIFMNNPDTCWGDGSFAHIAKLIGEGKKCILNSAIRSDKDAFIQAAYDAYPLNEDGSLTIGRPALAKLGYDNIHPYQRTTVWGQEHTSLMPSPVITPVGDEGFILNMAHLGTLCTISSKLNQDFATTTDGDYVNRVFDNVNDIHIIDNSDDVCVMELSDSRRYVNNIVKDFPLDETQVAEYLLTTASWETYSLHNFRKNLIYSWKPRTRKLWAAAAEEVSRRNEHILNIRQVRLWVRKLKEAAFDKDLLYLVQFVFTQTNFAAQMGPNCPRLLNLPTLEHVRKFLERKRKKNKVQALANLLNSAIMPLSPSHSGKADATENFARLQQSDTYGYLADAVEVKRYYIEQDMIRIHRREIAEASVKPLKKALLVQDVCGKKGGLRTDTLRQKYLLAGIIAHFFLCFGSAKNIHIHLLRFGLKEHYLASIYVKTVKEIGVIRGSWYILLMLFLVAVHFLRHLCRRKPLSNEALQLQPDDIPINVTERLTSIFHTMPVAVDQLSHNANSVFFMAMLLARKNHLISAFILAKLSSFVHPGHPPVEDFLLSLKTNDELERILGPSNENASGILEPVAA